MVKCNCCQREFKNAVQFIEQGTPIGTMAGGLIGYDLILVNCNDCHSTKAFKSTELEVEMFKTQVREGK